VRFVYGGGLPRVCARMEGVVKGVPKDGRRFQSGPPLGVGGAYAGREQQEGTKPLWIQKIFQIHLAN